MPYIITVALILVFLWLDNGTLRLLCRRSPDRIQAPAELTDADKRAANAVWRWHNPLSGELPYPEAE